MAATLMLPDTMSTVFPDRPIRPLPRRKLRERLSPEDADLIKYSPPAHDPTPLFSYPPYSLRDDFTILAQHSNVRQGGGATATAAATTPTTATNGNSTTPTVAGDRRTMWIQRPSPGLFSRPGSGGGGGGGGGRYLTVSELGRGLGSAPLPVSAASSIDGLDSFESNNKKKRKIPTAGDTALHSGTAATVHGLPLSTVVRSQSPEMSYSLPATNALSSSSSSGLSGAGRGRYGKTRNARSPLGDLSSNSNWVTRGGGRSRYEQWSGDQVTSSGIISTAIANAEKYAQGQENKVGLVLQQQNDNNNNKPSPTSSSTQFTFTCDSQVPGTTPIQWPGGGSGSSSNNYMATLARGQYGIVEQPPTNSHHMMAPGGGGVGVYPSTSSNATTAPLGSPKSSRGGGMAKGAPGKRSPRQSLAREYAVAAKQRRQKAQYNNYVHPPKGEDAWICEFCEYEMIFGEPPRALIRQYEIKDRQVRKKEEERRRLLEKAKAKGRKAKKMGGGGGGKVATTTAAPPTTAGPVVGTAAATAMTMAGSSNSSSNSTAIDGSDNGLMHHDHDHHNNNNNNNNHDAIMSTPPPPPPPPPLSDEAYLSEMTGDDGRRAWASEGEGEIEDDEGYVEEEDRVQQQQDFKGGVQQQQQQQQQPEQQVVRVGPDDRGGGGGGGGGGGKKQTASKHRSFGTVAGQGLG